MLRTMSPIFMQSNMIMTCARVKTLKIHSWNINGCFLLKLDCPEFAEDVMSYDINLFQETHLCPDQHLTVWLPRGYIIYSRVRRPSLSFDKSWGGVAAIVAADLDVIYHEDLSGKDFMVLQIGNRLIYNTYILPETMDWTMYLESDPLQSLASSLIRAIEGNFEVMFAGDPNSRTGSKTSADHHEK